MSVYLPTLWSSIGSEAFDRQIDRMFDEALRTMGTDGPSWTPPCNAWEDGEGFYVTVALPGWDPKDMSLEVANQILAVRGEQREESERVGTYHLREIGHHRFLRLFKLPAFVDHDKAAATHKNGLLTVVFPKKAEARVRQILIEGS